MINKDPIIEIIQKIKKCCIDIAFTIRKNNTYDLSSTINSKNVSGDDIKKIDIIANDLLINKLSDCCHIKEIISEENDEIITTNFRDGQYMIAFDPIDGSSNIDVNITIGTIFALYNYNNDMITSGRQIVMSGYCLYGGTTQLIIAKSDGVNLYTLDPFDNKFILTKNNISIKQKGNIYSINEGYKYIWDDPRIQKLNDKLIEENYSCRWLASLVADAHRTLIKGGIIMYPSNKNEKFGKIRLLYEACPIAYIFEIADGYSSNGICSILDIPFTKNIHQKTPIIYSSSYEIKLFNSL